MKKLLSTIGLVGMCLLAKSQDFLPVKLCDQDSIVQISKLKGKWKCIGHYYNVVYADPVYKNPKFLVGDTSYFFTDTFVNYRCSVSKITNQYYLYEMYNFKSVDANVTAYRYMFRTKTLPISIKAKCRNPYYELENEFIWYKDIIYYNVDGIFYKFKKVH